MASPSLHWRLETDADGIAWLTFDLQGSSANTLGSAPMQRTRTIAWREIEAAKPRAVIIRSAKDGGFIAGADINEFAELTDLEQAYRLVRSGQQVFDRLEALPMPTVAAIHGFALGGGLELALACDYRVGADDGKLTLGLPEVQLGVHPGFGGTVRAPQLIGAPAALDLMLTGKLVARGRGAEARARRPPRAARGAACRRPRRSRSRRRRATARPSGSASSRWPLVRSLRRRAGAQASRAAARIRNTTRRPTRSSTSSSGTAPAARLLSRPRRARSRGSSSATSRATWCASSSCRTA